MTNFKQSNRGRSESADPSITALLRATYSAPRADGYWTGLEQRILARVQEAQPLAWWSVFSEWRTAGLIAATLALMLAGAAVVRERAADQTRLPMANSVGSDSTYDAMLRSVLEGDATTFSSNLRGRLPADAPERYLNPLDW